MDKTGILAAALILIVIAASLFLFFSPNLEMPFSFTSAPTPPDAYYEYSENISNYAAGTPLLITVTAKEKSSLPLSSCNPNAYPPPGSYGCGQDYSGQPWCQTKTIFNARSIRIMIDGINLVNTYGYPNPDQILGYELSSNLQAVGPVCCWGYSGPCSPDCKANPTLSAYVYSTANLPPKQGIGGTSVFKLSVIPPSLTPGFHTLSLSYYAETKSTGAPACGSAIPLEMSFAVAGLTHGDQNLKTNVNHDLIFYVPDNTIYIQNTTQLNSLQAQLENVNLQLAQSQNESITIQLQLQSQKANLESQIQSLNAANANLQLQLNSLNLSLVQKSIIISQLSASQDEKIAVINSLNVSISEKELLIKSISAENQQLLIDKANLQNQVENLNYVLAQTQANLTALQGTIIQLRQIVQVINDSLNTAQSSITLMQNQITELRSTIIQTQAQLDSARFQLADVTTRYNDAMNQLEAAKNSQIATQAQLKNTLDDLTVARDANVQYRATLDNYSYQLQATNLLTAQQDATITQLRGYAFTKEQIANQSLALAAQKESEAQAALNEVVRIMAENQIKSAAFNIAMQELQVNLSNTNIQLSAKIAMLDQFSQNLQIAQSQAQNASSQLSAANAALLERQAALAQSQVDVAALQKANSDLKAQLAEEQTPIPAIQQKDDLLMWIALAAIVIIVLVGIYYWAKGR